MHEGVRYPCDECDQTFTQPSNYKQHKAGICIFLTNIALFKLNYKKRGLKEDYVKIYEKGGFFMIYSKYLNLILEERNCK